MLAVLTKGHCIVLAIKAVPKDLLWITSHNHGVIGHMFVWFGAACTPHCTYGPVSYPKAPCTYTVLLGP